MEQHNVIMEAMFDYNIWLYLPLLSELDFFWVGPI